MELRQGDYVTVEASQYPFPTVVSHNGEWFYSVRSALRWNTRGAVQKSWSAGEEEADKDDDPPDDGEEQWDIDTDAGAESGLPDSEDGGAYTSASSARR